MSPTFVIIGSSMLAAALLVFAWTMQHRQSRNGRVNDECDDEAIVATFHVVT
jgi:hypothetical protein